MVSIVYFFLGSSMYEPEVHLKLSQNIFGPVWRQLYLLRQASIKIWDLKGIKKMDFSLKHPIYSLTLLLPRKFNRTYLVKSRLSF